jgi:putative nucleotidyltransferase with HDIG domain
MDKVDFRKIVSLYENGDKEPIPAHSFENHVIEVYENIKEIYRNEDVDKDILEHATLLHDIGRYYQRDRSHAESGSEIVRDFLLNDLGKGEKFTDKVVECIRFHSNRPDVEPPTREAELLWVADKMHAVGAKGLCRFLLSFGGKGYSSEKAVETMKTRVKDMRERFKKFGFEELVPELGIIENFIKKYEAEKDASN